MVELIIGGVRSGKSALAQARAVQSGRNVAYIATASAQDVEMERRIAHHRSRRPAQWDCIEEPLHLAAALRRAARPDRCLLVDCLTLWLSNLFIAGAAAQQADAGKPIDCPLLSGEVSALIEALPALPGIVILVSNEVGSGVVPVNAQARAFSDEHGRLNQRVAAVATRVTLTVAGLPVELKATAN